MISLFSRNTNNNNQGTASIGDKRSLRPILGKDGFLLGKGVRMSLNKSFEHLALIGPTGSGKSSTFFIPNLLELPTNVSSVVTDPKGELYNRTKDDLRKRGLRPIQLAPFERSFPGYNPLAVATSYSEIKEIGQLLLMNGSLAFEAAGKAASGGTEWLQMSLPLLVAAFLLEKAIHPENPKIGNALDMILMNDLESLEGFFSRDKLALREFMLFKQAAKSEKTMASIRVTIASNMQLFMDDAVTEFAHQPTVLPRDLREGLASIDPDEEDVDEQGQPIKRPVVLFVSVPETKSLYAAPLMAVLYQQLMQRLQDISTGYPVLFFLDEFANIGIIPIIDTVAATARSRRMGLAIGLQGVEQLEQKYGKPKAQNLLNNLKTKMFLSGLAMESCKYASEFCGSTTIEMETTSHGFFEIFPKNKSKSFARREVLTPDEIRRLDLNKSLIIADNLQPAIINKIFYYKELRYKNRVANI